MGQIPVTGGANMMTSLCRTVTLPGAERWQFLLEDITDLTGPCQRVWITMEQNQAQWRHFLKPQHTKGKKKKGRIIMDNYIFMKMVF